MYGESEELAGRIGPSIFWKFEEIRDFFFAVLMNLLMLFEAFWWEPPFMEITLFYTFPLHFVFYISKLSLCRELSFRRTSKG